MDKQVCVTRSRVPLGQFSTGPDLNGQYQIRIEWKHLSPVREENGSFSYLSGTCGLCDVSVRTRVRVQNRSRSAS